MHGHLVLVTGEAVKLVDQNVVLRSLGTVSQHTLKVTAIVIRTGHSSVNVGIHDDDLVSLRVFLTNAKLTFNGLLGLGVAGISSVNDCRFQFVFLLFDFCIEKENGRNTGLLTRTTPLVQPLSLCGNRGLSLLYDFPMTLPL